MGQRHPAKPRSTIRVLAAVLAATKDAGVDGVRFTHLVRRANLGSGRARQLIGDMMTAGLVEDHAVEGGRTVVITPRGLGFLDRTEEFVGLADSMGLDI